MAKINEARHRLFTSDKYNQENIPPSQAALFEHINKALLQTSCYWNQATSVHQDNPDFSESGWQKENSTWQPYWKTLDDACKTCPILLHCCCGRPCSANCIYSKAVVCWTGLCKCEGGCVSNDDRRSITLSIITVSINRDWESCSLYLLVYVMFSVVMFLWCKITVTNNLI